MTTAYNDRHRGDSCTNAVAEATVSVETLGEEEYLAAAAAAAAAAVLAAGDKKVALHAAAVSQEREATAVQAAGLQKVAQSTAAAQESVTATSSMTLTENKSHSAPAAHAASTAVVVVAGVEKCVLNAATSKASADAAGSENVSTTEPLLADAPELQIVGGTIEAVASKKTPAAAKAAEDFTMHTTSTQVDLATHAIKISRSRLLLRIMVALLLMQLQILAKICQRLISGQHIHTLTAVGNCPRMPVSS